MRDKGINTFPMGISTKVDVIAPLKFELANFEVAVKLLSHYATLIAPNSAQKNHEKKKSFDFSNTIPPVLQIVHGVSSWLKRWTVEK